MRLIILIAVLTHISFVLCYRCRGNELLDEQVSAPTDNKPSLIGAWSGHVTH